MWCSIPDRKAADKCGLGLHGEAAAGIGEGEIYILIHWATAGFESGGKGRVQDKHGLYGPTLPFGSY